MITIKSENELKYMRIANRIVKDTLNLLRDNVKIGITTKQLDKLAYDYITKSKAIPSFLGYGGFPATICASRNEQVVHGIPNDLPLEEGDIISCDVGAIFNGWHGDAARTFAVGKISQENAKLIRVTEESFFKAVAVIKDGARLGDIGYAVQKHAEDNGFSVVRALVGHGIGQNMHEDPAVPNYGRAAHGLRLKAGMTLAVEPMINTGTFEVVTLNDGWTVVTADKLPSCHYENTVVVTADGCEILSLD